MRILAAIANHGTKNQRFLDVLLGAYRTMEHDVDVVVLSDVPKDLGPDVEVRVGAPTDNPWSLPFAHRPLFAERADDYDLFIYSEDDTHIEQRHVDAFVEVDALLPDDEVAGFQRYEVHPSGDRSYCSIHSTYRWLPETVEEVGGEVVAEHSNLHSACYMLTRAQLRRAIASGGFLVPAHEDPFDMLVSAATDPYTQCGLRRRICVSRLDDFLVHHLPNVYLGKLGITEVELRAQIAALHQIAAGERTAATLVRPTADLPTHAWDVPQHPQPPRELTRLVDRPIRRLLSIGSTSGAVERSLAGASGEVVAVPIDEVAGAVARTRDVRTVPPDLTVLSTLGHERFDAVLLHHVLHHFAAPAEVVAGLRTTLVPGGLVVVALPNAGYQELRRRFSSRRVPALPSGDFDRDGVHRPDALLLRRLAAEAGIRWTTIHGEPGQRLAPFVRRLPERVGRLFASVLYAVGEFR